MHYKIKNIIKFSKNIWWCENITFTFEAYSTTQLNIIHNMAQQNKNLISGIGQLSDGAPFEINVEASTITINGSAYMSGNKAAKFIKKMYRNYGNDLFLIGDYISSIHYN